jgi:DNA-binding NarL/FixJ family response regulator
LSKRILLVDDYASIRESLRILLEKVPGVEVIGEAEDGRIALELMHKLLPDIVIMDICMPLLDGIEATRRITTVFPAVKVIAFASYAEKNVIRKMFEAGATGFLQKGCGSAEIISTIKAMG